jgi:hypothetical protein
MTGATIRPLESPRMNGQPMDQQRPSTARAVRRDFVSAFIENARSQPGRDRPTARAPVLLTVAASSAALALIVGLVWRLMYPPKPASHESSTQQLAEYVAVSGWDCAGSTDHGFEAHGRDDTWQTINTGGWTDDGCHGTFAAIPMSASADGARIDQYALWWFATNLTEGRCEVQVYLPEAGDPSSAAGKPATYQVLDGRSGAAYAGFKLDQTATHGWVSAGTFPAPHGQIAIRLTNVGVAPMPGGRLAVTQTKVNCTG